ncbi:g3773 [Coccomyxa elongata]
MEEDADFTQITMSQRMTDKPSSSLQPHHNYNSSTGSRKSDFDSQRHGKLFNDPVHNHFRLDPVSMKIVDTPQFQRLADLKQLGCTYYVFRGASHARLEHSLGVGHLAYRMADSIYRMQKNELDVTRSDVKCAEVAGLVHDLGHGPYSHVFDRVMSRMGREWKHELMSVSILDNILADDVHSITEEDLSQDEIKHIKAMITSEKDGSSPPKGKRWLYEIVANNRNGLDVDKYDYLQRDSLYCNVKTSVDIDRIMSLAKVLDDEICYKYTEYQNVYEVFATRARMFRTVYLHKKARGVEHMIVDALLAAEPTLRLADKSEDPQEFVRLDDTIIKVIENWGYRGPGFGAHAMDADEEGDTSIKTSQGILQRLRRRDLYKFVDEFTVPREELDADSWKEPSAQDIASHNSDSSASLNLDNIIIDVARVDLSRGSQNPMDSVSFFDYADSVEKKKMPADQIGTMFPICNVEKHCRIYSRDSSPAVVAATQEAFRSWLRQRFGDRVQLCTPARRLRNELPPVVRLEGNPRKRSLTGDFTRVIKR